MAARRKIYLCAVCFKSLNNPGHVECCELVRDANKLAAETRKSGWPNYPRKRRGSATTIATTILFCGFLTFVYPQPPPPPGNPAPVPPATTFTYPPDLGQPTTTFCSGYSCITFPPYPTNPNQEENNR
jgi:hypothetical protein